MVYWGDATFYLMLVKDLIEHGSYLTNPSLGAPFGQQLYDFPQGGDNLNILVLWLIGLFTKDAALTMNLFYLLTYPIVALSALLVLRRFGMSRTAAFVCAVLFTMLPYHFLRGEGNVFLSAYWAVPLGAYLTLVTLDGGVLFARREGRRRVTRWLSRTTLGTLGICLVVGSTGLYYGAYAVLLVLVAAVVAGVVKRSRPRVPFRPCGRTCRRGRPGGESLAERCLFLEPRQEHRRGRAPADRVGGLRPKDGVASTASGRAPDRRVRARVEDL